MFSSNINDDRSIGASTADQGIMTGLLAMIIVNWSAFSGNPQLEMQRCMLVAMITIMILFGYTMSYQSSGTVDTMGHLGGSMAGLFWGFAFFPRVRSQAGLNLRKVGLGLVALFYGLQIILFFTVRHPQE